MLQKLKVFLNQPYPDRDDIPSMIQGAVIGGSVVFFILLAFKPFGISQSPKPLSICLLFGSISMVVAFIYDLSLRFVFGLKKDSPNWTFWKWAVSVVGLILCIALANYSVSFYFFSSRISHFWVFVNVLYSTFLIAIFPVALFGAVNLIRNLKANQKIAQEIHPAPLQNPASDFRDLPIHQSDKAFRVAVGQILFIEAQQNYVRLYLLNEQGIQKEMIRNTLARVEAVLQDSPIKRSHRSYLVNTQKVVAVSGNAQGLKLQLQGLEEFEVPVSRKYIPYFRQN
ncbi:MAG: LytR/AlgR family response regulator transcription factor [Bacteroidia bacterium]